MQDTLPIRFAPLQGYTEIYRNAWRLLRRCRHLLYSVCFTIGKGNFRRIEMSGNRTRNNGVAPWSSSVDSLVGKKQSDFIPFHRGYQEVDINLGCPFRFWRNVITAPASFLIPKRWKHCSALSPDIRRSASPSKWDWDGNSRMNAWHCAPYWMTTSAPDHHAPRLGKQGYKGEVDLQGFSAFREVTATACLQWRHS